MLVTSKSDLTLTYRVPTFLVKDPRNVGHFHLTNFSKFSLEMEFLEEKPVDVLSIINTYYMMS